MKYYLYRIAAILTIISILLPLTGCNSNKIQKAVDHISMVASVGEENAMPFDRVFTIKGVGKWTVKATGVYKLDGILYADSFELEGMFTRYDGNSFAWKISEVE